LLRRPGHPGGGAATAPRVMHGPAGGNRRCPRVHVDFRTNSRRVVSTGP